ncbi:DUF2115 domain-containing protein [Methanobrevibacter sp. OttesenSCG-928-K11]|nr:DUF2115 domain-containing protein [Methanobrevibacter sp. OttesenSCG-928-K11]
MKAKELFIELKVEMSKIKVSKNTTSKFNYDNYYEISTSKITEIPNENIDKNILNDLKYRLDYYFKEYPVYDEDFENLIKNNTIYLGLIKKEPFHQQNVKMDGEITTFKENDNYYCRLKKKHIKDKNSLCEYCIAKAL